MEVFEAMLKRRSCREYLDKEVNDNDIDKILHAAMSGPSAMNSKPWEFYVIKNKETIEKLRHASKWSNRNAPLAIVVCGNMKHALPLELKDFWIQDASAAIENILLEATELGLGSLWCGLLPHKGNMKNVKEILDLKNNIIPLGLIYIGYPKKCEDDRDQYDEKKIHIIK